MIEEALPVRVTARDNELQISGPRQSVEQVEALLSQLFTLLRQGIAVSQRDVTYGLRLILAGQEPNLSEIYANVIISTSRGKQIRPKTRGQRTYVQALRDNDIVFSIGPAGTGKTYLAMAIAVSALRNREVSRLILTRPAVEAGERLGFLPGDLQDKVDPYLRPLYDALFDILGQDTFQKYMERGVIEVAPLAYMRGRTLDDAYIILDEAQNSTPEQMMMFLTRLGFGSRAIVTGDITQIDLPKGKASGLVEACEILKDVKGIGFVHLSDQDVVRHALVQRIVKAYEAYLQQKNL
ncbi:MAG TPA: phosphate starvation-inducible protein PhoH [Firmicutes bacterium]|nr:phosphate starvation-inducible protein PhoH [Bacillota bacterium]